MVDADAAGGEDVVEDAIDEAETVVTDDWYDSKRSTFSIVDANTTKFEFRSNKKKTFRVDRVWIYNDDNTYVEYTDADTASEDNLNYVEDLEFNTITFHADTISAYNGKRVIVDWIPDALHQLIKCKAALIIKSEAVEFTDGDIIPSAIKSLLSRIKSIENSLSDLEAVGSNDEINYDPTYGDLIPQKRFIVY